MAEATEAEAKWLKRFRRVLKDAPPSVWLMVESSINVMQYGADGRRVMMDSDESRLDQNFILESFNYPPSDGGDPW